MAHLLTLFLLSSLASSLGFILQPDVHSVLVNGFVSVSWETRIMPFDLRFINDGGVDAGLAVGQVQSANGLGEVEVTFNKPGQFLLRGVFRNSTGDLNVLGQTKPISVMGPLQDDEHFTRYEKRLFRKFRPSSIIAVTTSSFFTLLAATVAAFLVWRQSCLCRVAKEKPSSATSPIRRPSFLRPWPFLLTTSTAAQHRKKARDQKATRFAVEATNSRPRKQQTNDSPPLSPSHNLNRRLRPASSDVKRPLPSRPNPHPLRPLPPLPTTPQPRTHSFESFPTPLPAYTSP